MREVVEFRVVEKFASLLFSTNEGKRLGDSVRKIQIDARDPRFARIGELQEELQRTNDRSFFYGWHIQREYQGRELHAARALHLLIASTFEPAGEECGTLYDEGDACPGCGAGASRTGPLCLDLGRIPKRRDFARTIAGENIVSRRVVDLFDRHALTGAVFEPVRSRRGLPSEDWYELIVMSTDARIVAPTRVGHGPFDDDPRGESRCARGDLLGLNLLSELFLQQDTVGDLDLLASQQFIGVRRGLLRPERQLFLSQKAWRALAAEPLKGYRVEVAHAV